MNVYEQDNVTIIKCETNIMGDQSIKLQNHLKMAVSKGKKLFLFQMSAVENMDTIGICALIALKKQLGTNGRIEFQDARESVAALLTIIG
ncbi:MAG: STAS domain-containing protein [Candidatus Magnetomorum sp.]|nr:STAS domain-containing protein [Candidatus Magnetomorum sp.]